MRALPATTHKARRAERGSIRADSEAFGHVRLGASVGGDLVAELDLVERVARVEDGVARLVVRDEPEQNSLSVDARGARVARAQERSHVVGAVRPVVDVPGVPADSDVRHVRYGSARGVI